MTFVFMPSVTYTVVIDSYLSRKDSSACRVHCPNTECIIKSIKSVYQEIHRGPWLNCWICMKSLELFTWQQPLTFTFTFCPIFDKFRSCKLWQRLPNKQNASWQSDFFIHNLCFIYFSIFIDNTKKSCVQISSTNIKCSFSAYKIFFYVSHYTLSAEDRYQISHLKWGKKVHVLILVYRV